MTPPPMFERKSSQPFCFPCHRQVTFRVSLFRLLSPFYLLRSFICYTGTPTSWTAGGEGSVESNPNLLLKN